jgi:glycerophosphoryl diester phosphodiesterase
VRTSAKPFGIVAHRGVTNGQVENTQRAFRRASSLGIDAVELDVRLTRDRRAAVHHDYVVVAGGSPRPIFEIDSAELAELRVGASGEPIPSLSDVLDEFAGRLGLEIELKGPEPEAADVVADLLRAHRSEWDAIEVTAFDGALLQRIGRLCTGLSTALLFPASEDWMTDDIVAYAALHRARAAGAKVVHLAAKQLSTAVVGTIRAGGVDVHAHMVDDEDALRRAADHAIPWVCTADAERALALRRSMSSGPS